MQKSYNSAIKKDNRKKKKDNPVKNGTVYLSNLVFKEDM